MRKAALLTLLFTAGALAQSTIVNSTGNRGTFAIRNATIYPVTSAPIANGTIVFTHGLITAVGANVSVPAEATVIDGTGVSVYPGLLDAGTAIGLGELVAVAGAVDTTALGALNAGPRADGRG